MLLFLNVLGMLLMSVSLRNFAVLLFPASLLSLLLFYTKKWGWLPPALVDQPIAMTSSEHHAECAAFFKDVILE